MSEEGKFLAVGLFSFPLHNVATAPSIYWVSFFLPGLVFFSLISK